MSEYQDAIEKKDGGSWLGYIAVLLLVNVLSYVFDWPFWIY